MSGIFTVPGIGIRIFITALLVDTTQSQDAESTSITSCTEPGPDDTETTCYTVYQFTGTGGDWDAAYGFCQGINQSLATIPDKDTQSVIAKLSDKFSRNATGGDSQAWVAGRLSTDTSWIQTDGKPATAPYIVGGDTGTCALLFLTATYNTYTKACMAQEFYYAVCQYEGENCVVESKGLCYALSRDPVSTWYDAVNQCGLYPSGTLAPLSSANNSLLNQIVGDRKTNDTYTNIWTGIHSRSWQWVNESEPVGSNMQYFNWQGDNGEKEDDDCVYVDFSQGGQWANGDCGDKHNNVICQWLDPIPETTTYETLSSTTDGLETSGMETDPTTIKTGPHGANKQGKHGLSLDGIIGIAVAGGVLLIVIVVVSAVCCYRHKRKEKAVSTAPSSTNQTESGAGLTKNGIHADPNPYTEVPGEHADDPNPYATTGPPGATPVLTSTQNNRNDPMKVMYSKDNKPKTPPAAAPPESDVYALPHKRTSDSIVVVENTTYGGIK